MLGAPRGVRWTFDVTTRQTDDGRQKIIAVRKGYDVERGLTLWASDRELRQAWEASARTGHRDAQIIPWQAELWGDEPGTDERWRELVGETVDDALGTADEWSP